MEVAKAALKAALPEVKYYESVQEDAKAQLEDAKAKLVVFKANVEYFTTTWEAVKAALEDAIADLEAAKAALEDFRARSFQHRTIATTVARLGG